VRRPCLLAIESSCDETAAAVIADNGQILSSVIASQQELHAEFGGVVPEIASRAHVGRILPTIKSALTQAKVSPSDLSAVAVTSEPGLVGSLLVGLTAAKTLAMSLNIPLVTVNHIDAHIYACGLGRSGDVYPCVGFVVSGGHTNLYDCCSPTDLKMIGGTTDDAAGEAFDKAARILELGYPGGPAIEHAATNGSDTLNLPRAWLKGTNDFSFSGLKTALMRLVDGGEITSAEDAAASFQSALVNVLVRKTVAVAKKHRVNHVLLVGGVASNRFLRRRLIEASPVEVLIPDPVLCTDNAAMIAACGYYRMQNRGAGGLYIDVYPSL